MFFNENEEKEKNVTTNVFHIIMICRRKKQTLLLLNITQSSKNMLRFSNVVLLLHEKINKRIAYL